MHKHLKIVWLLLVALLLTSCSTPGSTPAATPTETPAPTPTTPAVSTPMPGHAERTVVTLGLMDFSDLGYGSDIVDPGQRNIVQAVALFNSKSREYKIKLEYYGQFSKTNNDALLVANAALSSSENVPDLLYLTGLPYEAYIQRGLLMDLSPFMDADRSLTREDMLTCVREASEVDGKIYFLSPSCFIDVYGGNSETLMTEDFADTEQIFRAFEAQKGEGRSMMQDVDARFFAYPDAFIDHFIDFESWTCSFQSDEFLHALELLDSLPRKVIKRVPGGALAARASSALWVTEGYSIMFQHSLNRVTDYVELETLMEGDYVPAEYPFTDGKYARCQLSTPLAIPTNSKHPEGAWEFIRYLFQSVELSGFPTTNAGVQAQLMSSGLPELWETQREGEEDVREQMQQDMDDPYGVNVGVYPVVPLKTYPFTEDLYEEMMELLEKPMMLQVGLSQSWKLSNLQQIVFDELVKFLEGSATAEQTAQALQSRVEIYLAEQT